MEGSKFKIVCDLETSGSCPINNGVIAACILIIDENCNVADKFTRYVRPPELAPHLWSIEAQGVHGITIEQAAGFMPNDQFCYELLCFLGKYREFGVMDFICHASPNGWFDKAAGKWKIIKWFDYFFLEWCFRKALFDNGREMVWTLYKVMNWKQLISTVKMGRDAGHKKNDLKTWAERLNFSLNHHDAESDTYCALEIYKYLRGANARLLNDKQDKRYNIKQERRMFNF